MLIHKAVPTNIVTGALGVGKTTFIKALLKAKPANERWAVLINEFGEIGVDATMLIDASFSKHSSTEGQHIFVREVPGGCMCCTSSLSMQIALNQLLAAAKPHRLIIEPSGLGHPKEVIQILQSAHYRDVITLDNTVTPWQNSVQQVRQASVGINTKPAPDNNIEDIPTSTNSIIRKDKSSEGLYSRGWVWPPDVCFDHASLMRMLKRITVLRLKAVFITYDGIFSVNLLGNEMNIMELDEAMDSRLEFIADSNESAKHTYALLAEYIPLAQ